MIEVELVSTTGECLSITLDEFGENFFLSHIITKYVIKKDCDIVAEGEMKWQMK